jgi:chromosome segregation ATPase
MARSGLYKLDVKKARESLIAQSVYPSIDAVRMALGNTGSKTTIHKYLRELEEEDGGTFQKASISEALRDLVERLASRLQDEAQVRVAQSKDALAAKEHEHANAKKALEGELVAAREAGRILESQLSAEVANHAKVQAALQSEAIARHTAEQHVADLKDRLAENEQHRKSLEEKHSHAREALEHYRQSAKDQREQDLRRHEEQVQQVQAELRRQQLAAGAKQEEVTKLNQEGAHLVAELAHTKQSLYEQLTNGRKLEQKIEQLQTLLRNAGNIERQLASKIAKVELLGEQLNTVRAESATALARSRELELELAQANAKAEVQEQIGDQFRAYLDKIATRPAAAKSQS